MSIEIIKSVLKFSEVYCLVNNKSKILQKRLDNLLINYEVVEFNDRRIDYLLFHFNLRYFFYKNFFLKKLNLADTVVYVNGGIVGNQLTALVLSKLQKKIGYRYLLYVPMAPSAENLGYKGIKKFLYKLNAIYFLSLFKEILTISNSTVCELKKIINKSMPVFLLIENYLPNKKNESIINQDTLVFCGRLEINQKGLDLLIDVLKKIDTKVFFKLNIIGDGPDKNYLLSELKNININIQINFLGWVNDTFSHICNSDGLILTSRFEGIPMVLIETIIAKKNIFCFEVPQFIDYIDPQYQSERYNTEQMADKISNFLKIPRNDRKQPNHAGFKYLSDEVRFANQVNIVFKNY